MAVAFQALSAIPEIAPGDELPSIIADALTRDGLQPQPQGVLVVAQKVVSKAEDRFVDLSKLTPGAEARKLATETGKDPRLVEAILSESRSVLRYKPGVIVVEHRLGYVMANAGIDRSNIGVGRGPDTVLLLPRDPDGSAAVLRTALEARYGVPLGIIISDSFGRAWRNGVVNVALGVAGLPALVDARGRHDRDGRLLEVTEIAFADALAAGAALVMGEGGEGSPVVHVRGAEWHGDGDGLSAAALLRPCEEDMFR